MDCARDTPAPGTRADPVIIPSDEDVLLITVDAHARSDAPPSATVQSHSGLDLTGEGNAAGSSNLASGTSAGGLYARKQAVESTLNWLSTLGASAGKGGALIGTAAAWLGKHTWHLVVADLVSELLTGKGVVGWAEDGLDALIDAVGSVKDYVSGGPSVTVREAVGRAVDIAFHTHAPSIQAEFPLTAPPLDRLRDLCAHTYRPKDVGLREFCAWLAELAGDVNLAAEALRILRSQ